MGNTTLAKPPDRALARALRAALDAPQDEGRIHFNEICKILRVAGSRITDVEFRDLKRLLRTQKLWGASARIINAHLQLYYPLKPAPIYKNVEALDGSRLRGSHSCAALVQGTLPIGRADTWRAGTPVRGNGHLIKKGTPIATFVDGYYPNRDTGNHVAYYLEQSRTHLHVIEQFKGLSAVQSRWMRFGPRNPDGTYPNASNNGSAFSVIMKKA